jgi:hypothetical protein
MKKDFRLIYQEKIETMIFIIRGKKVMIDRDLASLYEVETKVLNQAVKRNIGRFPDDFMFQLDATEFENWKSQFVTSNSTKMGLRKRPYAFTEHGILMLSSVLNSERAIEANIQIMRTFTKLRELMLVHKDLRLKIENMEKRYDSQFKIVFDALRKLLDPPEKKKTPIGFIIPKD